MQWDVKKVWQLCLDVPAKDHSDALDSIFTSQSSWENLTEQAVSGGNDENSPYHCIDDDHGGSDGDVSDVLFRFRCQRLKRDAVTYADNCVGSTFIDAHPLLGTHSLTPYTYKLMCLLTSRVCITFLVSENAVIFDFDMMW